MCQKIFLYRVWKPRKHINQNKTYICTNSDFSIPIIINFSTFELYSNVYILSTKIASFGPHVPALITYRPSVMLRYFQTQNALRAKEKVICEEI